MNVKPLPLVMALALVASCAMEFRFAGDGGSNDAGPMDAGQMDAGDGDAGLDDAGHDAGAGDAGCTVGSCSAPFGRCAPSGLCVECLRNADCPGNLCDPQTGRCGIDCELQGDSACDPNIYKRKCSDDLGFPSRCSQCKEPGDCPFSRPVCATGRGWCVACLTASHCGGATPVCDVVRGECVAP